MPDSQQAAVPTALRSATCWEQLHGGHQLMWDPKVHIAAVLALHSFPLVTAAAAAAAGLMVLRVLTLVTACPEACWQMAGHVHGSRRGAACPFASSQQ